MKSIKEFILWPILPFGGETQPEDSGTVSTENVPNVVAAQDNSVSTPKTNQINSDEDDDDPYNGLSAKELRRILKDTESSKAATESAKAELEKRVKESEDAQLSKEQKLEKEVQERDSLINTLKATNAKLAIMNAINQDSRFQWHDSEIVAQQLNSSVVKVNDDGKVEGIAKELARVAKDHEYLLKSKGTQQDSQNGRQQQSNDQGPTGFQPGQGGANQGGQLPTNAAELAKTFPALSNRI